MPLVTKVCEITTCYDTLFYPIIFTHHQPVIEDDIWDKSRIKIDASISKKEEPSSAHFYGKC